LKILIVYYSMYGHIHRLADAVGEGARQVPGAEVLLRRVPETMTREMLRAAGALSAQESLVHVPVCTHDEMVAADAIVFGTPTRFGNMCGQMRQFLDTTGGLWQKGALVGKVAGVFTSTGTQHGGQETTIQTFIPTLLHHGMIVVGLPYTFPGLVRMDEITGGSPYGASTLAGPSGERSPSENELEGARFQGRHIAEITAKLAAK